VIPILTPEEMAAVDAAAPDPVEVLIERAGAAVAHHALVLLHGAYGRRVILLAGKGNNGADGRAAARQLRRRGVRVEEIDAEAAPSTLPPADLVIDAAYGTGFHGKHHAPEVSGAPVLAVDIPSGIDGTTGEERGRALQAVRTVTFAALKPGLVLEPGRSRAGEVVVADIGLDVGAARAGRVEAADVAGWLPRRPTTAHKWSASVLVIAGSVGMTGAGHLAAAAAQRTGAGMVRLGSPGVADDPARPTEAVGLELPSVGWAGAVLGAAERFQALVIGPGLGTASPTEAAILDVLAGSELPTVVDGDGLTALGRDVARLATRSAPTVLTPHDGEYERLAGRRPEADRLAAARSLAAEAGSVVLLKGPTTVIAAPDGEVRVVGEGDARLATAGTGDVLSGAIGALLSRGAGPFDAAAAGAWLHARAGASVPADGLVASDLVDALPNALSELRG
jgi:ADP-dependent NAD(P)H-hydrate dehydratase / NAD(P)H-hydrate epimerase